MTNLLENYKNKLHESENSNLKRSLQINTGIDFCSNDYLSFATDKELSKRIIKKLNNSNLGSTGSRLISGYSRSLQALEEKLAEFSHTESSIYFTSTYQANMALISSLIDEDCQVFSDELNHASIIDSLKATKCQKYIFKHNDPNHLELLLKNHGDNSKHKFVIVEYIYSMDGDMFDFAKLKSIVEQYNAYCIVDCAHATAVVDMQNLYKLYDNQSVIACVHSAGKALGISGGWIACSKFIKEYLINYSRPLIYSTAPSPLLVTALSEAIDYHHEVSQNRIADVFEKAKYLREKLGLFVNQNNESLIIPLIIGKSKKAIEIANNLMQKGWAIRAIRKPTVPENLARIRITIKFNNTAKQINDLANDIIFFLENEKRSS